MKALIVGDFHDRDLSGIESIIENPTHIISLGDFDIIKSIADMVKLSREYKVIAVAGNHEHAFLNDIEIYSSTMDGLRTTTGILHTELIENRTAREYVKKLTMQKNLVKTMKIGKFKIAIVHGALSGYLHNAPDLDNPDFYKLWYRLLDKEDMRKNFVEMKKQGFNLMIRGHDHEQNHMRFTEGEDFVPDKEEMIYLRKYQSEIIRPEDLNVITSGAYCEGLYAVLEDDGSYLRVTYGSI